VRRAFSGQLSAFFNLHFAFFTFHFSLAYGFPMQLTVPETLTVGLASSGEASELVFLRGRRADTAACRRTIYYSRCGLYRLEKSVATGLPVRWRACLLVREGYEMGRWEILSVHRQRSGAEAACRRHAKGNRQ
jgi:hypothetical protein